MNRLHVEFGFVIGKRFNRSFFFFECTRNVSCHRYDLRQWILLTFWSKICFLQFFVADIVLFKYDIAFRQTTCTHIIITILSISWTLEIFFIFFFLLIYHPNCHRHTISLFNRELFNAFVFIADAYKITSTWRVPPIGSLQISQWHERWRWRGEDMGRTDYYEMERESESIFFYDCVGNDVFHLYVLHL